VDVPLHEKADRDRLTAILARNPTREFDGFGPVPVPHEPLAGKKVRLAGVVRKIDARHEGGYSIALSAPTVDSTTSVDCFMAARPLVLGSTATVEGVLTIVVERRHCRAQASPSPSHTASS